MSAKPRRVAIAGAGIAGLTAALTLLDSPETGVEHITLFEPRLQLDTAIGGALNINGGAAILAKYGLDLWPIANPMLNISSRTSTGRSLFKFNVPDALDAMPNACERLSWNDRPMFMTVMRDELQSCIAGAVSDRVTIRRHCSVSDVLIQDGSARILLESGQVTEHFDMVVGADGLRSKVRTVVTGVETSPTFSGITVMWAISPRGVCTLKEGEVEQIFGNGAFLLRYAAGAGDDRTELLALSFRADRSSRENAAYVGESNNRAEFRRQLNKCGIQGDVVQVLEGADRFVSTAVFHHRAIPKWSAGGVCTLIGDAAHAMPPYLGQGANQAIADAHVLSVCIAGIGDKYRDLSDALAGYEAQRKIPVEAILQTSKVVGLIETQSGLGTMLRNNLFRFGGATGALQKAFITAAKPVQL